MWAGQENYPCFLGDRLQNGSPYAIRLLSVSLSCLSVCLSLCLSVTLAYCNQTVGWIKMKLGMQVGLGPGHIVLDGDPATLPKGHSPQFSADICCGQMAVWIKMPLIGLGPGDCVRWGPRSPSQKGGGTPAGRRTVRSQIQLRYLVADRFEAGRGPVADLLARAISSLLAKYMIGQISARCRSATSFEPSSNLSATR